MQPSFDTPSAQQFNVFNVVQVAPGTFLDGVLGLDFIVIPPSSLSETHMHRHSDNVILVIRGHAQIILNDVEFDVMPGLRISIPRGMWHAFRTSNEPLEFISAQIPPILDKVAGTFDREIRA